MTATTQSTTRSRPSLLGPLVTAAENGRIPDAMVRFGIRQLLKSRLGELKSQDDPSHVEAFIEAANRGPIAALPQKANEQHYEVPAEFFQTVLGPRMKYSCCYWPTGVESLEDAEDAALEVTCRSAGLADGMDILELGCGWGSLSLWMARQFPSSRITAVSNSNSQRRWIERQASAAGMTNLVVKTADINEFSTAQSFDRVVSVEMFEHMRNHGELMRRIAGWLRPSGQLFVHIFCHRTTPYLFDSEGEHNWMGRHFFSGGMMPSFDLLTLNSDPLQLVNRSSWSGLHYAKTCRAWLENLDAAGESTQSALEATYGREDAGRWKSRWRIFFMACEELFRFRGGEEWFVAHYQFER